MRKKSRLDRHRKGRRLHTKAALPEPLSKSPPQCIDYGDAENLLSDSAFLCLSPRTDVAHSLLKLSVAPPPVPLLKTTVSTQTEAKYAVAWTQTAIEKCSVSSQTETCIYVVQKSEASTQTSKDSCSKDAVVSGVSSAGTLQLSLTQSARRSLKYDVNTTADAESSIPPTEEEPTKSIGLQITSAPLCLLTFKHLTNEKFHFFTGLSKENFEALYVFIGGDVVCTKLKYSRRDGTPRKAIKSIVSPRDRLFMTLLRIRRAYPIVDIAFLFGLSTGWVSSIIYTWIRFLRVQLECFEGKIFPSAEFQNLKKSEIFKDFPNLRAIIDATEFKIQHPYNFRQQTNTYSTYKSTNTLKYLVAFSCLGGISYISRGFEGSISDKNLLKSCGFLKLLRPGDVVMCDRGFDVESDLNALGVQLVIPPFLGKRTKLSAREAIKSKDVSSVRTYIEIAIGRIKFFRILRGQIPNTLLPVLDDLVYVTAMLTLFDPPFISCV